MKRPSVDVIFDRRDLRLGIWWPRREANKRARGCTVHLPCIVFYVTWED